MEAIKTVGLSKLYGKKRAVDNLSFTIGSGERTGAYLLGGEELILNDAGESIISYADYAIAMVDEIEKGDHIQQRISVVRK